MRTRLPAIVLIALWVLGLQSRPVQANGTPPLVVPVADRTPVPTLTREVGPGTSAFPDSRRLLTQMRLAMTSRGSVHVDFHMLSPLYPTGRVATHLYGDVSWKLNLLHDTTVVQKVLPTNSISAPIQNLELLLVNERAASRTTAGEWQCTNMDHVNVLSTLLGLEGTILSSHTVGTGMVAGRPTWTIRAVGYSPATGSVVPASITFEISQADRTLLQVSVAGSSSFGGRVIETSASETYSNYGEPVHVRLPVACSSN